MKKSLTVIFISILIIASSMAQATNFNNDKFDAFCVLPTQTQNFTETYEGVTHISTNPAGSKDNIPVVYFVDKDSNDIYMEGYYCKFDSVKAQTK